MRNILQWRNLSSKLKAGCLYAILIFCWPLTSQAEETSSSNIRSRPDISLTSLSELSVKLREITGWQDLKFDQEGSLRLGVAESIGGSRTARELLSKAASGDRVIVIEDASRRNDVVFCQVVEGRRTRDTAHQPPVYIILVDFADFSYVTGDRAAVEAFNVGWGFLHEIDHVINDSLDPQIEDETGECEGLINQMRRECGLAERAQYFFSHFPGVEQSGLMNRYVRLAFDGFNLKTKKKRRYWLIWDASLVGGLTNQKQIADTR